MPRAPQKQPYPANVTLLTIENAERVSFRRALVAIPKGNYEVEQLSDGRTVCIVKPGGKVQEGYAHDFEVLLCDSAKTQGWRISHTAIYNDVKKKLAANRLNGEQVIKALWEVHDGKEPKEVLAARANLSADLPGHPAEALLKVYKWVWGQEDCNFPDWPKEKGRTLSMDSIEKLLE